MVVNIRIQRCLGFFCSGYGQRWAYEKHRKGGRDCRDKAMMAFHPAIHRIVRIGAHEQDSSKSLFISETLRLTTVVQKIYCSDRAPGCLIIIHHMADWASTVVLRFWIAFFLDSIQWCDNRNVYKLRNNCLSPARISHRTHNFGEIIDIKIFQPEADASVSLELALPSVQGQMRQRQGSIPNVRIMCMALFFQHASLETLRSYICDECMGSFVNLGEVSHYQDKPLVLSPGREIK